MEIGIELIPNERCDRIVEYAVLAEKSGFDFVWVTEHYNNRSPYPILSLIAHRTSSMKIGIGVTNPYTMHPALIASNAMTIDEISGGRTILGISAGDMMTLRSIGIKRERSLRRIREAVEIIRLLFKERNVTYKGEIFSLENAEMSFFREVPIYIGAQGKKMIELGLEIGDGVMINSSNPEDFRGLKGFKKKVIACTAVCVDDDVRRAKRIARIVVGYIIAGSPRSVLEEKGIDLDRVKEIRDIIKSRRFERLDIEDELLDEFCIYGDMRSVASRIKEFADVVDQVVIGGPIARDKYKVIKEIVRYI